MPHPGLGQNSFYWSSGQGVLEDPIIPPITGGTFLKFAVATGVVIWMFRKLGRG